MLENWIQSNQSYRTGHLDRVFNAEKLPNEISAKSNIKIITIKKTFFSASSSWL